MVARHSAIRWMLAESVMVILAGLATAAPSVGVTFTYQGHLADDGSPANGAYDFVFTVFDAEVGGTQQAPPVIVNDLSVTNGLFTAELNFFTIDYMQGIWLEIAVRPGPSTDPHTTLGGRTYIHPTPAALQAFNAQTIAGLAPEDLAAAEHSHAALVSPDGLSQVLSVDNSGAVNLPGGAKLAAESGGNHTSLEVDGAGASFNGAGGGSSFSIIALPGVLDFFIGGAPAGDLRLGGGHNPAGKGGNIFLEAGASTGPALTGGDVIVKAGANDSNLGGSVHIDGGSPSGSGHAPGSIRLEGSSTAGGGGVLIEGGSGASDGVIGGGGGDVEIAAGDGTGPMQHSAGNLILRAGRAPNDQIVGSGLVMISSPVTILRPTFWGLDPGAVLQVGGLSSEDGNGAYLSSDGVWTNTSDANKKTVVGDVDAREVLARVLALPLKNWRHRGAPNAPLHLGPMAQDFFAAFGLGSSERHIGSVDADGVALAAIQGLHAEADERLRALEAENQELRERLQALEQSLQAMRE